LGRGVIELIGVNGADQADVVGDFGQVREGFGDFHAALAVLGEFELRAHHGGVRADEGEPLTASDGGRQGLAVHPGEFRLGVEKVEVAGGTGHEEVDDGFGFARIVRLPGLHWIDGSGSGVGEGAFGKEAGEGDLAEADPAIAEEVAAGEIEAGIGQGVHGLEGIVLKGDVSGLEARWPHRLEA
jgi:hypothetical protein